MTPVAFTALALLLIPACKDDIRCETYGWVKRDGICVVPKDAGERKDARGDEEDEDTGTTTGGEDATVDAGDEEDSTAGEVWPQLNRDWRGGSFTPRVQPI